MTNSIPSVYGVNKYLWSRIKGAGILSERDYNGMTPIIPTQEEPTFIQAMESQEGIGNFPYIVYAWYTNGYDQAYYECTDTIVYLVYSRDEAKLRQLVLLVNDLFKRYDESARPINDFIDGSDLLSPSYKSYDYKFTSVSASQASLAKDEENGSYRAMITIRVGYTHDEDGIPLERLFPTVP